MSIAIDILRCRGPLIAMGLVLGGCAAGPEPEPFHPVWPPPPAPPRIVHRLTLTGPGDLKKPSFFDGLDRLITGRPMQKMIRPHGIAMDKAGHMYVTDQELQGVHVLKHDSAKARFIGRAGKQHFVSPVGVAVCDKLIAVSDSALKTVVLLTPKGKHVRTLEKPGGFGRPTGLAFNPTRGELYVVDTVANDICVFDVQGRMRRRFGSTGDDIGQFNYPTHISIDSRQRVFVTDSLNFRVQVFDPQGRYLFYIGRHGDASGHLGIPKGVATDRFGHIYVNDSYFSAVQIFNQEGQFLLSFGKSGDAPGSFQVPTGLMIDDQDRIYVCDSYNSRVQVFQYVGGADDEH